MPVGASVLSCFRRKSQQAEREYEKVKHQLENLEESVRDRCKKEFTGTRRKQRPKKMKERGEKAKKVALLSAAAGMRGCSTAIMN